jgi:hypothetical protein
VARFAPGLYQGIPSRLCVDTYAKDSPFRCGLLGKSAALKTSFGSINWLELILKIGEKVEWEANSFQGVIDVSRLCTFAGLGGEVPTLGVLAFVCSRSGGSHRPHVCGKSPKELAFAVPMWTRGKPTQPRYPHRRRTGSRRLLSG